MAIQLPVKKSYEMSGRIYRHYIDRERVLETGIKPEYSELVRLLDGHVQTRIKAIKKFENREKVNYRTIEQQTQILKLYEQQSTGTSTGS